MRSPWGRAAAATAEAAAERSRQALDGLVFSPWELDGARDLLVDEAAAAVVRYAGARSPSPGAKARRVDELFSGLSLTADDFRRPRGGQSLAEDYLDVAAEGARDGYLNQQAIASRLVEREGADAATDRGGQTKPDPHQAELRLMRDFLKGADHRHRYQFGGRLPKVDSAKELELCLVGLARLREAERIMRTSRLATSPVTERAWLSQLNAAARRLDDARVARDDSMNRLSRHDMNSPLVFETGAVGVPAAIALILHGAGAAPGLVGGIGALSGGAGVLCTVLMAVRGAIGRDTARAKANGRQARADLKRVLGTGPAAAPGR